MKKKMKFPDGSVREIDEADVATARSLGAVDFSEAPAQKNGKKVLMQFNDGQTKEVDSVDVAVAESLGAVKKKETSDSGAATSLQPTDPFSLQSLSRSSPPGLAAPEVTRNPYGGVIEATKNAAVEKRTSIYNEAVSKKNLQPLVDYVNEEKENLKKKKDEFAASQPTEVDLTGANDLILATQVDTHDDTFKADDEYIRSIQKGASAVIDAVMADKFLEKRGAEKLIAAKELGQERRALRSAIGEEPGFQDEMGELDYIQKNMSNPEDAMLKLSGAISINTKETQQMHDYKNEFGIYASSIAKMEDELIELYDGNENIKKFHDTKDREEATALLKDPQVADWNKKLGTYDLITERLNQLPNSYPYVKWELDRSRIADKWSEIIHNENEIKDIVPGQSQLRVLKQLFAGEKPNTDAEIKRLAAETGIPEDRVKEVIDTYGSETRGIYVPSTLGKVLRGGTNVVNSTIQGLAREVVDTDKANLINKQLNKGNYKIPEAIRKDWSVDRIIDTMANGLGQFAGFVTVARLGGAPFEALAGVSEAASIVGAIQKANSIGSTFATGFLSSYEDAYQYAATQTDDEEKRREYADGVAGFNGVSELILRDIDVANKILKGKSAAKILDEFAATRTPFTATDVFKARAGEFAKVLGYESAEELVPYFGEAFLKNDIFGNKTSTSELFKGALDTVIETAISTIPMGGFSATSVPTTKLMQAALLEAAKTPEIFNNRWEELHDKGMISNSVMNRNIQVVNTLADIYTKLPDQIPGGKALNEEEKAALVHDIFSKRQLENFKKETDPSLAGKIDEQIGVIDNKINDVINPAAQEAPPKLLTPEEKIIDIVNSGGVLGGAEMAIKADPSQATEALRFIAQQTYGITETGEPAVGGIAEIENKEALAAAKEKFPTPESTLIATTQELPKGEETNFTAKDGNQVVDEKGDPLVVYHGSKEPFSEFDESKIGTANDHGIFGTGYYFTPKKSEAKDFSGVGVMGVGESVDMREPFIYEAHLNIKNPLVVYNDKELNKQESVALTEQAKKDGHDGIIVKIKDDVVKGEPVYRNWYIAFDKSQIKQITQQTPKKQPIEPSTVGEQKPQPIKTEATEIKDEVVSEPTKKIRVTAEQLKSLQPKQQKDFLARMRSLADNIEANGIRAALPDWAKADLPEGTQEQGFGGKALDKAAAKAIRLVADAIEKGKLLTEAIEGGFSHLKSYYTKNTKQFDEQKLRDDFTTSMNDLFAQMKPEKPRIRVRVPTIPGKEYEKRTQGSSTDPIDSFSIIYGSNKIIQDVLATHEKRDASYTANPTDYERNTMALKSMSYEMDRIVGNVLSQNTPQDAIDYFVSKLQNPDLPLWVRNLLMGSLQRSLRGRPDILNNIRTNIDVAQATESSLSLLSRQDWLAERGLSEEQEDELTDSVDGGDEIIMNKIKAQEAFASNEIDEETEVEVASRSAEDIKADMDSLKQKSVTPKKSKKEPVDKDKYLAKAAMAENRILMSTKGESKKKIVDRIKEIIAKC